MASRSSAHPSAMTPRAFLVVAASIGLVACVARTTSLGASEGNQSSASSADADAGMDGAPSAPCDEADGFWYTWKPEPTEEACEYFVPPPPVNNDDPRLLPANWDPTKVRIEVWVPGTPDDYGPYVKTGEECESGDGWYYADPGDAGPPSRFVVCPKSCATAMQDGGQLRISATTYCQ